jgi:glycine cleavage system aminomethyltransferase T
MVTWVPAPTLGKTLALAYVRHEVSDPGAKLNFPSGVTAEVASLPFYQRPPTPMD